jgi:3-oxoacyl-[acyl-carrier protein] reductase
LLPVASEATKQAGAKQVQAIKRLQCRVRGKTRRMIHLAGRTAVVTGSSSGIGRAIAIELAQAGANVVVHARHSETAAAAVSKELRELGVQSTVLLADLSDPQAAEELVERAWSWQSGLDIWINNAGADTLTGAAARWPYLQKLEALWQVDVRGTMICSRAVGGRMAEAGNGVILNIGWDQAERGMGGDSGELFGAVKGAVMAFTRSLAKSLAPNVRVNCLAPGWIKTAWGEQASDYWQDRAQKESLLRRWGTPADVAKTATFLVSPAASFITGQIVAVDGGL